MLNEKKINKTREEKKREKIKFYGPFQHKNILFSPIIISLRNCNNFQNKNNRIYVIASCKCRFVSAYPPSSRYGSFHTHTRSERSGGGEDIYINEMPYINKYLKRNLCNVSASLYESSHHHHYHILAFKTHFFFFLFSLAVFVTLHSAAAA